MPKKIDDDLLENVAAGAAWYEDCPKCGHKGSVAVYSKNRLPYRICKNCNYTKYGN